MLKPQDDQFRDSFRHPHDVGRSNRFVRGNHYKIVDAILLGYQRYVVRTKNVIPYGLETVRFHHRHVLVRGGVED